MKTSAPGKMVIAGEYAVLEGYEALSVSISRRVHVRILSGSSAADFKNNRLVEHVFAELESRAISPNKGLIEIDSSELSRSRLKLGVGSSSAIAVALSAALCDEAKSSFDIALGAHRRFTENRGSGIDVATSFYGGAIRYELRESPVVTPCTIRFDTKRLVAVHTGVAQSTSSLLARMDQIRTTQAYRDAIAQIGSAAKTITSQLTEDTSFATLKDGVRQHNLGMQKLAALAGAPLLSSAHNRIQEICDKFGGIAKPSGAGGGDISICFMPSPERADFATALLAARLVPLDFEFCGAGLESPSLV